MTALITLVIAYGLIVIAATIQSFTNRKQSLSWFYIATAVYVLALPIVYEAF
jgi:hypothetical protein